MNIKQLLEFCHQILDKAQIDHALIGGLALGVHGIQRFTNDVDFLIGGADKLRVKQLFLSHGFNVYFESPEVLQLNSGEGGSVDFLFANRELSQKMLKDAPQLPSPKVKCVGLEDIIGLKIQAFCNDPKREFQDKADIQALIDAHPETNWKKVKMYADVFGVWQDIEKIRNKVGK